MPQQTDLVASFKSIAKHGAAVKSAEGAGDLKVKAYGGAERRRRFD